MVESIDVTVKEHKIQGTIALVSAKPGTGTDPAALRAAIEEALGQFTVHYEVKV